VGEAAGHRAEADALAAELEERVATIAAKAARAASRPRVVCLEWLDPYYVGGHWVPEMVFKAGGEDVLGRLREPSFRVSGEQIIEARPDVIVVMPCGYNLARAAGELRMEVLPRGSETLPAIREGRLFAVDANAYFSRPGPRLAEGAALLAHLFHPGLFPTGYPEDSFRRA
jgi:iron complex transport system substrate-binding protein